MGEHEENRMFREIVLAYSRGLPAAWNVASGGESARVPGEIVEVYRQPDPKEVVESYRRALPEAHLAQSVPPLEMRMVAIPVRGMPREPEREPRQVRPTRRRKRTGLWIFAACVLSLVALTVTIRLLEGRNRDYRDSFEHYGWDYEIDEEVPEEITIPRWPTGQDAALFLVEEQGEALTIQEVYKTVNPSVVTVLAEIDNSRMSVGTGVIFTEDGYLVTNYHVVEGGRSCTVVLDTGVSCDARYVAGDKDQDLAVLKITPEDLEANGPLPAAVFGDSDLLTVGDPVYAIGNPLGWELRGTLTDGIVSAINRDVEVDGRNMTLIQTNAALNSGNSGGPLINAYGQVVGINVIKMSSSYSTVEGLGFAIPSALMERMVNDLTQWGELQPEPALGVTLLRVPTPLEDGLQGLEVQTVSSGSPAERAGVRAGDYVLAAAGEPVSSSQEVLRIRRRCHLGDELTLTIWRGGETLEVTLLLDQATE